MKRVAPTVFALLTAGSLALSGCSAGSEGKSQANGSTDDACNLEYVGKQVAKYEKIPEWTPPGPVFDATEASDTLIYTIQENTANPFSANIVKGINEVAQKAGIETVDYPNQGRRTQWAQGVQQAIRADADGIIFVGGTIGPIYFKAQAKAAQEAGLKLVTVVDTDVTQPPEPLTDARVAQPYAEAARLNADWIINDTQCNADVLVLTTNELIGGDINTQAVKDEFAKYCGSGCKVRYHNVPLSNWSSQIQPTVQSAIQANPELDYVFPLYDAMVQFTVPGIRLAGAAERVKVTSFNGTPAILRMIQEGDIVQSDIGENEFYLGYAAMDQMMRLLAGEPPIKSGDMNIGLRIFDDSNVAEAGVPPGHGVGYGDEWKSGYLELWGLE